MSQKYRISCRVPGTAVSQFFTLLALSVCGLLPVNKKKNLQLQKHLTKMKHGIDGNALKPERYFKLRKDLFYLNCFF